MYLRKLPIVAAALLVRATPTSPYDDVPSCDTYAPAPISLHQLPGFCPPPRNVDASSLHTTEAAIRRTLALYPLAIDGRAFSSLTNVFAQDAVANYSAPIGVLKGPDEIASSLEAATATFLGTQHLLGTTNVRLCEGGKKAISATYYTAVHFLAQNGTVGPDGIVGLNSVLYAYGQYQDTWEKRSGDWKVVYRNLVYMVRSSPTITSNSAIRINVPQGPFVTELSADRKSGWTDAE